MGTYERPVVMWFRQDLRLGDNPALCAAVASGRPVLPLYILDDVSSGAFQMGAASRWWLRRSLQALDGDLDGCLCVRAGSALEVFAELDIEAVYFSRCYEPWRMQVDAAVSAALAGRGVEVFSFNGSLLFEPDSVLKADGSPYRVFTPFYKNGCLGGAAPRVPVAAPSGLRLHRGVDSTYSVPDVSWAAGMEAVWTPGEDSAGRRLSEFVALEIDGYLAGRDYPSRPSVSRLSPHLAFGELSPNQAWYELGGRGQGFLRQLCWREFSYSLLYHLPDMPYRNIQARFDDFPWVDDAVLLRLWQRGQTGYPMVDAGMRELWRTGYMHNRVRMIVGSFLVKNLLLHWRLGEEWFWDTLLDADLANNSMNWQWVAGCGVDAAPYFRVFNPVLQGQKFDGEGVYVRKYVPELAALPDKHIHSPWLAGAAVLRSAGLELGVDYPLPVVDLRESRNRALAAFKSL